MSIMTRSRFTACLAALAALRLLYSSAFAALPVEIEVAIERGTSLTAPQEWSQLLGKMDLLSVRLRSIRPDDRPEVTSRELGAPQ